jgi:hypothetical protein
MSQNTPASDVQAKLPRVRYQTWGGVWSSWEPTETSLLAFVYDFHVFVAACGVFPPFHLLNQVLLRGGGGGGMGPGAKWEPFSLTREEYGLLAEAIRTVPPSATEGLAGPVPSPFTFDPEFDGPPETYPVRAEAQRWNGHIPADYKEYAEWAGAVCRRHRQRWHAELKRAR